MVQVVGAAAPDGDENIMRPIIPRLSVALSLLSLVLMILACAAGPAPPPPGGGQPAPPVPNPPAPPPGGVPVEKPDAELTALQYQAEFGGGRGWDAYQRYKDRFLKVTGKLAGYGYDLQGVPLLFLDGNKSRFACEEKRPASKVLPGQTVTLRGKPTGALGVEKWAIVSVTGEPPPTVSAEQLLQDLVRDKAGTDQKWKGKTIVLSGQVAQDYKNGVVYLTPPAQPPSVGCWFYAATPEVDRERLEQLKAGRKVRIVGMYEGNGTLGMSEPIEVLP